MMAAAPTAAPAVLDCGRQEWLLWQPQTPKVVPAGSKRFSGGLPGLPTGNSAGHGRIVYFRHPSEGLYLNTLLTAARANGLVDARRHHMTKLQSPQNEQVISI